MATQEIRATVTGHSADTIQRIATPRHILIDATGRSRPAVWLNASPLPGSVITGHSDNDLFLGIVAQITGRATLETFGRAHLAVPLRPHLVATIEAFGRCGFVLGQPALPSMRATIETAGRCRLATGARLSMRGGG